MKKVINLGIVATLASSLLMTNIVQAEETSNTILSEEMTKDSSNSNQLQSSSESKSEKQDKESESSNTTDTSSMGNSTSTVEDNALENKNIKNPKVVSDSVDGEHKKDIDTIDNWMPDKNLQMLFSKYLKKDVANITKADLTGVTELDNVVMYTSVKDISNLEGIQYATNLNTLNIKGKGLANLSPLNGCTSLEKLAVLDSNIQDISGLNEMPSLLALNFYTSKAFADGNRSTDVETLYDNETVRQISSKFPNLEHLELRGYVNAQSYLSNNRPTYTGKITDISPLAKLTKLKTIELATNEITDFSMIPLTVDIGHSYQQVFLNKNVQFLNPDDSIYRFTTPSIIGQNGTPLFPTDYVRTNLQPNKRYNIWQPLLLPNGGVAQYVQTVSTAKNLTKIEAHDSTIPVGSTWKPIDNFDSAIDDEGNPLDFSQITVTGTVNTSQPGVYPIVYSFNGTEKKIHVTVEGGIELLVPSNISFGTHKLVKGVSYYQPESIQRPITITDKRGIGNNWQLTVKLQKELTNANGKTLPNALIYKENSSEKNITTVSSQLIASKTTTTNVDTTDVSANWSNNQGLLLKINAGDALIGEYTGTIEWTLNDTP